MNPFKGLMNEVESIVLEGRTDVISLIKADHRKVDQLFKQYKEAQSKAEKKRVMLEIINDLKVHAAAEESKVYPTLDKEDHEGTNESFEEHHLIKILIEELAGMLDMDDKTDAKVKVLSEVVHHHVKEEESKYLPELKDSDADLEKMGASFTAEKERLQKVKTMPEKAAKKSAEKEKPAAKKAAAPRAKKTAAKAAAKKEPTKLRSKSTARKKAS